jgi:hypothetical protein
MKRFSEKLVAATVFVAALGSTLVVLPLATDNPALALDSAGVQSDRQNRHFPLPSERVEARIAYVKAALQITDAEASEWNAVADVMRRQAKELDGVIPAMLDRRDAAGSIIDEMERHEKILARRATDLTELIAVAKPLYASLSPNQKQAADALLPGPINGGRWEPHEAGHGGLGHYDPEPDGPSPR